MLILFFANLNEFECPGNVYGRLLKLKDIRTSRSHHQYLLYPYLNSFLASFFYNPENEELLEEAKNEWNEG